MFSFWKCGVSSEKREKLKSEKVQPTQWLSYRKYWDALSDLLAVEKIEEEEKIGVIEHRGANCYKVNQIMKDVLGINDSESECLLSS